MAEIPFARDELANDLSKLRNILGYESQEIVSEDDSSIEDDYASCEEKCEYTEDEIASGSSSGHFILPEACYSSQNDLENNADNSDNKLELCLALNRSYQHRITDLIEQLKELLMKNRDQQQKLLDEITDPTDKEKSGNTKNNPKSYTSKCFAVFEAPYFRDINGQFAPPNEDAIIKDRNKEVTAYVVPYKSWSDLEKKNLETAVALNAKEKLLNPLLMRKQVLRDKLKNKDLSESEYEAESAKLEKTNATITSIKETPKEECIGPRESDVDWLKISAIGLDGSRTPEECKLMWDNLLHPSINKDDWDEAEDNALWDVAEQHNFHDWDSIAEKLRTNRTSWQCLRQYQQKIRKSNIRGPWSKSEDDLLRRVVEACRSGDFIPWHQVAYYLEGRTRTQIQNRWLRCICPDLRKGTWTIEEDVILLAAIKKHGVDWTKVCNYLPGRNNTQCRERYKNTLEDGITLAGWTADEDLELLRLVKKHGEGKWAFLAQQMKGRLDNSIFQRFRLLKSKKPDILDYVEPDVTPDVSILPHTIYRPGQCSKAIKRRKEVYEALKARNINLDSQDEKETNVSKTNELLENRLALLKHTQKVKRGHRRKKSQKDEAIDAALDAFLVPLLSVTGPFIKSKCLSMTGVEWMQASTTKLFLFKLFKCDDGTNKDIDIPEKNYKLFEETKEEVENLFRHLVIGNHCEDRDSVVPVIPPNRATLSGFKVVLSSRKRLIVSAKKMKNLNVIPVLTTKLVDSVQCLDCLKKQGSMFTIDNSQETKDAKSNGILSKKTQKRNAEDSDFFTKKSPSPKKRKRKGKYDELIERYSKPLEPIEELEIGHSTNSCQNCERMKAFHADFQLLHMRFLATFFWPALLSTLVPNADMTNENETADEENSPTKAKKVYRKKKRKQKKPWVTESLKRRHLEKNHTLRDIKPKQKPKKKKGKYKKADKNQLPTRRSTRCTSKAVTNE